VLITDRWLPFSRLNLSTDAQSSKILDIENIKHASLAQQNGFSPAFFLDRILKLAKGTAQK